MPLRVEVDRDACVSAGRCVAAAPAFFQFDDDELVVVDDTAPLPKDALLLRIAKSCPSQAIHVYEGDQRIEV